MMLFSTNYSPVAHFKVCLRRGRLHPMDGINLSRVTRTYTLGSEEFNALNKVDLKISAGDFVAITGPSGSGKSTLANIIGGLDKPTSGTVTVNGQDLANLKDAELSAYRNK